MKWNEVLLVPGQDRRQPVSKKDLLNFPYNCIGKITIGNKLSKN